MPLQIDKLSREKIATVTRTYLKYNYLIWPEFWVLSPSFINAMTLPRVLNI